MNNRNHFKKHTIDTMLKDQSRHFKEYETSRRWIALANKETQNKTTVAFDTFDKQIKKKRQRVQEEVDYQFILHIDD